MLEGLEITLTGMFAVFSFLFILVCAVIVTSKLICLTNLVCPMAKENENNASSKNTEEEIAVALCALKAKF